MKNKYYKELFLALFISVITPSPTSKVTSIYSTNKHK